MNNPFRGRGRFHSSKEIVRPQMPKFTVVWTLDSFHGSETVEAYTPEAAMDQVVRGFSKDFHDRALINVYAGESILKIRGGLAEEKPNERNCRDEKPNQKAG